MVLTETCLASWSSCCEILTESVVSTCIRACVRCWPSLCLLVTCCELIKVFKCQWFQHTVSSSWSEVVLTMSHRKLMQPQQLNLDANSKLISVSHTSRKYHGKVQLRHNMAHKQDPLFIIHYVLWDNSWMFWLIQYQIANVFLSGVMKSHFPVRHFTSELLFNTCWHTQ